MGVDHGGDRSIGMHLLTISCNITASEAVFISFPNILLTALYKMLSYRRETALQGTLVLAESGRLELRDNILLIL